MAVKDAPMWIDRNPEAEVACTVLVITVEPGAVIDVGI
jgi:hypothetical protein